MNDIDCGTVRGEIYLYLEHELSEERRVGFAAHIQACERCRDYEARVSEFDDALEGWEAPEPSAEFVAGVMARVAQHERNRRGSFRLQALVWGVRGVLHSTLRVPLPVGIAAAAILVLSVSLNFVLMRPSRTSPPLTGTSTPDVVYSPPSLGANPVEFTAGEPQGTLLQPNLQQIVNRIRDRKDRDDASGADRERK
jgi:anti-sigma factor RsiW